MAKCYELTTATWFTDLAAALKDYYGDGVTIHSSASAGVVFSCPQISDKYMRITLKQYSSYVRYTLLLHVANEIDSSGALVSAVTVNGSTISDSGSWFKSTYVVAADKFLFVQTSSTSSSYISSILVAKCTNGRYLFVTGAGNELAANCMYSDTLTAAPIRFISMSSNAVFRSSGKLVMLPSYFANDFEMELNADGSFAYIDGLFCTSRANQNEPTVGENYYISASPIRGNAASGTYVNYSLYVELEP